MSDAIELPVMYDELPWQKRREVRNEYARLQEGKCMWCGDPLSGDPPDHIQKKRINWRLFPPNFLKYPVHLQHSHQTGLTEGAVHARCNAVLWQYYGR